MNQFRFLFGFFFITIGSLLLAHNFYPFFVFESVWRLWPLILLLLGISSLVKQVTVKKILMSGIGLIAGIIIFSDGDHKGIVIDSDSDEKVSEIRDSISVPYDPALSDTTYLSISAGAASIDIGLNRDSSLMLIQRQAEVFENDSEINGGNLDENNAGSSFSIDHKIRDGINRVDLEFGGNLTLFGNQKLKKALVLLNPRALWNIDIDGGATSMNADLSALRIATLNLQVGASSISLKLGSIQDTSIYHIEGGAAKFVIDIPEDAGCRIIKESGLSRHHFPTFIQKADNIFESPNYSTSKKKIILDIQTGVSSITVKTYKQKAPEKPFLKSDTSRSNSTDTLVIKPNEKSKQL
ncbi:MAG: LiaI-LiaF-like domain-containing protein [Candidatus Kapaibacteriota bacterium]